MDDTLIAVFVDPRTSRILLDVVRLKRVTVKELCERNPEIPRSTMYRLLTRMERSGLVDVVDYKQKRGTVEKTYALHPGALPGTDGIPKEGITYSEMADVFLMFCIEFANRFRAYAEANPGKADARDAMGFWTAPVYGTDREVQKRVLRCQMELAGELGLPVIIHDREAHKDSMDIVKSFPGVRGVFHCYSGSVEMARELLDLGWYLSFTGSITFKKARKAPEVIRFCPMDRLMLETDSPYLAPEPHRGHRNDSRMLPFIAQVVAEEKGLSTEEVARITMENGKRFFGIE